MLRKLALSLAVAGVLASTQANALGLGDIRIKSALNEPLNAEIQLHQIRDLNPLQIRPRMADQDEFALAGLSQQRALSDIRFQVKVNPNGTGVILLTSRDPVKEPFINFLVEVNWPSGRLVREYTLLLDPPVFDPSPTQRQVEPAVFAVDARPNVQATLPGAPAVQNIRTQADKKSQAYVDVKDTLWGLAIDNRGASDISAHQMMVAMYKKNPQAFLNGNINNLKAGVVLNLPTDAEARALSAKDAIVEVNRQTVMWKRNKNAVPEKAPIDGSNKNIKSETVASAGAESGEADKGQLKVVTPAEPTEKDDVALKDQNNLVDDAEKQQLFEKNERLVNQLAVSAESLDRLERDNVDLNDKLDSIQQQLDSLLRLVELKDQQLAALQNNVNNQSVAVVAPPPAPEKSLLDKILQTPEYLAGIGAGLIAVIVGLLLMLRRKKKTEDAADDDELLNSVTDDETEAQLASLELDDVTDDLDEASEEALQEISGDLADNDFDLNDDLDDLNLDMDMDLDLDESFDSELDALSIDDVSTSPDADEFDKDDLLGSILDEEPTSSAADEFDEDDLLGSILDEDDAGENTADDEFDLGLDELTDIDSTDDLASQAPAPADAEDELELDELDALLADDSDELDELDVARNANERSGMGMLDPISDLSETEDTLESLGLSQLTEDAPVFEEAAEEVAEKVAEKSVAEESDNDLEFNLTENKSSPESEEVNDLEAQFDGLDFDLDDLDVEETPDVAAATDEDELAFESDLMADLDSLLEEDAALEDEGLAEVSPGVDDTEDALELAEESGIEEEVAELKPEVAELEPEVAELSEDPFELDLDVETPEPEEENVDLAGFDLDDLNLDNEEDELPGTPTDAEVTEELTSNIEHDLDTELDDELEALLNSTDNDIALEETSSEEEEQTLDALGFLDGADEVETKLDLARAYIDMDDIDGARDILDEIAKEGNDAQKEEANELLGGLA